MYISCEVPKISCNCFFTGDEVLAVNGQACHELAHVEALALFKAVRSGCIELRVCRRVKSQ